MGQNCRRDHDPLRALVPQIITMKITLLKYITFSRSRLEFGYTQLNVFTFLLLTLTMQFNFFSEEGSLRSLIVSVRNLSILYFNLAPIFRHSFD